MERSGIFFLPTPSASLSPSLSLSHLLTNLSFGRSAHIRSSFKYHTHTQIHTHTSAHTHTHRRHTHIHTLTHTHSLPRDSGQVGYEFAQVFLSYSVVVAA